MRAVLAALLLAGCAPPTLPPASQYRMATPPPPVALAFPPDADAPTPEGRARLLEAADALPPAILPELYIAGPRALPRALAVRRLLQRPVAVLPPPPGVPDAPDAAVVAFPGRPGVVADACLEPGAPPPEGFWPGSGLDRPRLLPEGCAVASAIAAQVNAHAGASDLLRGRPLEPGAASPFADAAERYYRRNDPGQRGTSGPAAPNSGGGGPASGAAPASGVNPLLGPLPDGPSGTAQPPGQARP